MPLPAGIDHETSLIGAFVLTKYDLDTDCGADQRISRECRLDQDLSQDHPVSGTA